MKITLPKDPKERARALRGLKVVEKYVSMHSGQKRIFDALFKLDAEFVYVNCGRKFGKSHFACIAAWVMMIMRPGAEVYYTTPTAKLAKELVWANRRMQTLCSGSDDFIKDMEKTLGGKIKIYDSEMRIVLPTGSFVKVDNSNNIDNILGLKPDLVVCDEYRTFKPQWLEFMRPNMLVKPGVILFITTPPLGPNHAYDTELECRDGMRRGDPRYFHINLPTLSNDKISWLPEFVKSEKQRLETHGRQKEFIREYMAQYVSDSEYAVLPQISRHTLAKNPIVSADILGEAELILAFNSDDATSIGCLFCLYDRAARKLFVVDEIKQTDSAKSTLGQILPEVDEKIQVLKQQFPSIVSPVLYLTNGQVPWLARDLSFQYNQAAIESDDDLRNSDTNLQLIKDLAHSDRLILSPKIWDLVVECEKWMRDPVTGRIPYKNRVPLLVDCLRFVVSAADYGLDFSIQPLDEIKGIDLFEEWELKRIEMEGRMQDLL